MLLSFIFLLSRRSTMWSQRAASLPYWAHKDCGMPVYSTDWISGGYPKPNSSGVLFQDGLLSIKSYYSHFTLALYICWHKCYWVRSVYFLKKKGGAGIPKLYVKFWWPLFLAMKFTFLFLNLAKIHIFIPKCTKGGSTG